MARRERTTALPRARRRERADTRPRFLGIPIDDATTGEDQRGECIRRLQRFHEAIDQASELIKQSRHNPVTQNQMESGDIELF